VGGLPTGTVNGLAAHPTNPSLMYVAMRDGVFRSEDAGGRWTLAARGPRNAAAVAVNPNRPSEVYAVTVEGELFLSRDGGATWDAAR
jgi:photosystem II stability/assembly factor-like uncharacterized protein